ncbi:hypothetical protein SAMN05444161_3481 [Rhizobiales bacterium GAS191]|nr:hypothetical protein SAMN05444161_3481 [Rhizobiales bacterium GAS191]
MATFPFGPLLRSTARTRFWCSDRIHRPGFHTVGAVHNKVQNDEAPSNSGASEPAPKQQY